MPNRQIKRRTLKNTEKEFEMKQPRKELTTAEFAKLSLEEKAAILQINDENKKPIKSYCKIETNKILENAKFL